MRAVDGEVRSAPAPEPPSILSKAFDLLQAFNAETRVMTLSELARASGLPKSTVHRLIARLIDLGAIEQHRSGYTISVDLLQVAVTSPAASLRDTALPFLAALHRWSGLSVQLAVLRQFDVVYLERIATERQVAPRAGLGSRLPANCTALGKALLSREIIDDLEMFLPRPMPLMTARSVTDVDELVIELRKARSDGLAHEHEDSQLGLAGVAAPIVVHEFAVGAVAVTAAADAEIEPRVEAALRDTAAQIARVARDGLAQGRSHWFPKEI